MSKLYPLLLALSMFLSCETKHKSVHTEDQPEAEIPSSNYAFTTATEVDTVFSPYAPARITRNIKLDKQGRLLMAAYDDIIRFDGRSFVRLHRSAEIESWYAFDVLEDRQGNIWIASDQSGAYRIDTSSGEVTIRIGCFCSILIHPQ